MSSNDNFEFSADLSASGKAFKVRPAGVYTDPVTGAPKERRASISITDGKNYVSLTPLDVLVLHSALQDVILITEMKKRAKEDLMKLKTLLD